MNRKIKLAFFLLIPLGVILLALFVARGHGIAILNPAGVIAQKQRNLILFATLLSLIVILPVFALTFIIAWRYRASNIHARYMPEWDRSRLLESVWWGVPTLIILVLAVVTWKSSHDLDPFRPIDDGEPMTVQVVAMDWKWLFIYPGQNIATINYLQFPVNTPIRFEITSDAPMNSFWIPRLGGQIYAMSSMSTHLNLEAAKIGAYRGSSANISGRGFAGMNFLARATSQADFDAWVMSVKESPNSLTMEEYAKLSAPSENNTAVYYSSKADNLYNKIVSKYMPSASAEQIMSSESPYGAHHH